MPCPDIERSRSRVPRRKSRVKNRPWISKESKVGSLINLRTASSNEWLNSGIDSGEETWNSKWVIREVGCASVWKSGMMYMGTNGESMVNMSLRINGRIDIDS